MIKKFSIFVLGSIFSWVSVAHSAVDATEPRGQVRSVSPASPADSADFENSNSQAKIPLIQVFTGVPETVLDTLQYSFMKERIPAWATILATTAILYQYDQDIYDGVTRVGRRWNIGNGDGTRTVISAAD